MPDTVLAWLTLTLAWSLAWGLFGWWLIRTLRRDAPRRWIWPLRWSYYGLLGYLVALGGVMLLRLWLDRLGLWALY